MTYVPNKYDAVQNSTLISTSNIEDLSNVASGATNGQVLQIQGGIWTPKEPSTTHTHSLNQLANVSVLESDTTGYDNLSGTADLMFRYRAVDAVETGGIVSDWPAAFAYNSLSGFAINNNDMTLISGVNGLVAVRAPSGSTTTRLRTDIGGTMKGKAWYCVYSENRIQTTPFGGNWGQEGALIFLNNGKLQNASNSATANNTINTIFIYHFQSHPTDVTSQSSCYPVSNTFSQADVGISATASDNWLFANNPGAGRLQTYEILIYNTNHTQGQRDDIINSLAQRYNPAVLTTVANNFLKANTEGNLWSNALIKNSDISNNKYDATVAPTAGDDGADGFEVGSVWIDITLGDAYICVNATNGAAVWKLIT